ncbi:Ureidoglycolate hydrolase [Apiospora kogelbergensis]|uniref:Ureidoglycolate hydrolase n=1 Tax=Apiospora kogelbergensis TaxID=1337665 RepID=A0AAW0QT86_9PEZI
MRICCLRHPDAGPLTRTAFTPFGEVLNNPAPEARPSNTEPYVVTSTLPFGAELANQGTAIKYAAIASLRNLYNNGDGGVQAPSGRPAEARMTMFVCGARMPLPSSASSSPSQQRQQGAAAGGCGDVEVKILERHPFTTQTFIPLTADASKRYLVIVAPSLPPSALDEGLPVPVPGQGDKKSSGSNPHSPVRLPGRGMPDLSKLCAFIATGDQAVTYGAGTWHAPMVALGPPDTTVDFLVFQFANDTALEDCQEVALETRGGHDSIKPKILVRLDAAAAATNSRTSKL